MINKDEKIVNNAWSNNVDQFIEKAFKTFRLRAK